MHLISAVSALAVVTGAAAAVSGPYLPATAPSDNLWAAISVEEADSIRDFLDRQSNVTMCVSLDSAKCKSNSYRIAVHWPVDIESPPEISFNTYNGLWLLPPNKTDALAYLDSNGPKPPRYARLFGTANCFDREFMIG
jgi:hypothetical protein